MNTFPTAKQISRGFNNDPNYIKKLEEKEHAKQQKERAKVQKRLELFRQKLDREDKLRLQQQEEKNKAAILKVIECELEIVKNKGHNSFIIYIDENIDIFECCYQSTTYSRPDIVIIYPFLDDKKYFADTSFTFTFILEYLPIITFYFLITVLFSKINTFWNNVNYRVYREDYYCVKLFPTVILDLANLGYEITELENKYGAKYTFEIKFPID